MRVENLKRASEIQKLIEDNQRKNERLDGAIENGSSFELKFRVSVSQGFDDHKIPLDKEDVALIRETLQRKYNVEIEELIKEAKDLQEKIPMIKQDMMILKFASPFDAVLRDGQWNTYDAVWEEDTDTMYAIDRYQALLEFNKLGYRVLQFIPDRHGGDKVERVLVERIER